MASSIYLWHYTRNCEGLQNILKKGFLINEMKETFEYLNYRDPTGSSTKIIKAVCFTNLSEEIDVKNHIDKYGLYAIGLTQSWANKHKISPVAYLRKEGKLTEILKAEILKVPQLLNYCKQYSDYESDWCNDDDKDKSINVLRRYDEREWRYIPDKESEKYLKFNLFGVYQIIVPTKSDKCKIAESCKDYISKIRVSE